MIRILGTVFAGLLGLAFGSFLNVCLSRWPEGESVVGPRSHCRDCDHVLAWWENVPLLSWLALRGRCRECYALIGWRYPLVEFAVAALWTTVAWDLFGRLADPGIPSTFVYTALVIATGKMALYWLLVALAFLDVESFWLPDRLTYPGIILGFLNFLTVAALGTLSPMNDTMETMRHAVGRTAVSSLLSILAAAGLVLLIRWIYWLIRRREGMGLGDAKLMALLAAWLGLPGALFAFALGVVLGAAVALSLLVIPSARNRPGSWFASKLPLGTFLCIGGVISSLWGESIIAAYLRWSGF
jgi:leader peptidase (prepilin peptidase) / N-methyltransferase